MAEPDHEAKNLSHVLLEEAKVICHRRRRKGFTDSPGRDAPPPIGQEAGDRRAAYRHALEQDHVGLSFSGGGIRSATFNLGVLQALADLNLLKHFDYLSTVSGGGYIGSWLSALCHRWARHPEDRLDEVTKVLTTRRAGSNPPDQGRNAPGEDKEGGEPEIQHDVEKEGEPEAIRFLRRYSNYLTPSVGLLTADTWAVVTTYLRNLLLNLLVLASTFAAVLMLPRLLLHLLPKRTTESPSDPLLVTILAGALTFTAVCFIGYNLGHACRLWDQKRRLQRIRFLEDRPQDSPPLTEEEVAELKTLQGQDDLAKLRESLQRKNGLDQAKSTKPFWRRKGGIQLTIVAPLLLAAFLGTFGLSLPRDWNSLCLLLWIALLYTVAWGIAALVSLVCVPGSQDEAQWGRQIFWAPLAGIFGGALLMGIHALIQGNGDSALDNWQALTVGPPLILGLFTVTAALHTGLVGRPFRDYFREWLSRVGAWLLIYGLGWAALFAVTVYGPPLVYWLSGGLRTAMTAGWLGTTLAGLLASRSSSRSDARGKGRGALLRAVVAKVAPYVFIVGLLLWLAVGIDFVLDHFPWTDPGTWTAFTAQAAQSSTLGLCTLQALVENHAEVLEAARFCSVGALWLLLAAAGVLLSWRVDVNEFSMHRLYRNRLVRCYLGSTLDDQEREALRNPFTGFNPGDDIPISELRPPEEGLDHTGPYHIVNAALNLVGGSELAWQERKADSFVFTPLFCGFAPPDSTSAYRASDKFGNDPKKLTLGSALAISGAAASPNMGFRSSPALAFLLTVFNVRLGWWLGNPRSEKGWSRSGPSLGLLSLLREVLGMTTDRNRYVYLSDGGHFENLGVYELVRRRCRFILACDAGQDNHLAFDDLGNAIRKCRTDLDIEIEIRPDRLRLRDEAGHSAWHCAVGTIRYDRVTPDGGTGILLYLKSSLTGDEPEDILNYATQNSDFPHQTTADQWFGESQFESYRRLGHHIAKEALEASVKEALGTDDSLNFEAFLQRLQERWHPPSGVAPGSFSGHGAALDRLFERLRSSENLEFLHSQFYPEWASLQTGKPYGRAPVWLPEGDQQRTEGFYFCNSLIQLMESVYLDLGLEESHGHPDNRGWINLFKHWSWSGMFQVTWAISAATYGHRFQNFCRYRLGLKVMDALMPVRLLDEEATLKQAVDSTDLLNFHERDILRALLDSEDPKHEIDSVYALQVVVNNPLDPEANNEPESLTFGCGFALLGRGRIVAYRIQDHLRNMGLGRQGILALAKHQRELGHCWPPIPVHLVKAPEPYSGEFSDSGRLQFRDLVRSVERELGNRPPDPVESQKK